MAAIVSVVLTNASLAIAAAVRLAQLKKRRKRVVLVLRKHATRVDQIVNDIKSLGQRLKDRRIVKELENVKQSKAELNLEFDKLDKKIITLEDQLKKANKQTQIAIAQSGLDKKEIATLKKQISQMAKEKGLNESQIKTLTEQLTDMSKKNKSEVGKLNEKISAAAREQAERKTQIEKLTQQLSETSGLNKAEVETLTKQLSEAQTIARKKGESDQKEINRLEKEIEQQRAEQVFLSEEDKKKLREAEREEEKLMQEFQGPGQPAPELAAIGLSLANAVENENLKRLRKRNRSMASKLKKIGWTGALLSALAVGVGAPLPSAISSSSPNPLALSVSKPTEIVDPALANTDFIPEVKQQSAVGILKDGNLMMQGREKYLEQEEFNRILAREAEKNKEYQPFTDTYKKWLAQGLQVGAQTFLDNALTS